LEVSCCHWNVDDDAGDAEGFLHFIESVDHGFGVGEVAWDVQLVGGAVGFFHGASGDADFEAFRSKELDDGLADVGTRAEDEGDWGGWMTLCDVGFMVDQYGGE
jgi:hypothetical protein